MKKIKENYILIAYQPDEYDDPGCSCCRGPHYSGHFDINQFDNTDGLAKKIVEYAIKNSKTDRNDGEYSIWLIYKGQIIISDGDPSKELFDIDNFEYDDDVIEWEIEVEPILKELDDKIGKLWRIEVDKKKEAEQVKKSLEKEKIERTKKENERKKEVDDKKLLKELAKKYPDEIK